MEEYEKRPCTVSESLEQSLKEMQKMQKEATAKRSWRELKLDLAKPLVNYQTPIGKFNHSLHLTLNKN